jgi:hypothetical protein
MLVAQGVSMRVFQVMVLCLAVTAVGSGRAIAQPTPEQAGEPASTAPGNTLPIAPTIAPGDPSGHRTMARQALIGGLIVTASASMFALYSHNQMHVDRIWVTGGSSLTSDDCDRSDNELLFERGDYSVASFRNACTWHTRQTAALVIAGAGAVTAVIAAIVLLSQPERPASAGRGRRPAVAIAPVVTATGGGASLSLTW